MRAVLLAEDHEVTRFGMSRFLNAEMKIPVVDGFATYPQSLSALREKAYDLAIFDLDIPGLGRSSDLADVRRQWPAMRLVVMSGLDNRDTILGALAAGVHGYIPKSVPMADVAKRITYVMSGEIYVPSSLADLPDKRPSEWTDGHPEKTAKPLTARQSQVLAAMTDGLTNKQIGKHLKLSESTVKLHVAGLFQALGVKNRAQAVMAGQKYLKNKR
jgi:DNA-binding NarL/FixJ family response regulator